MRAPKRDRFAMRLRTLLVWVLGALSPGAFFGVGASCHGATVVEPAKQCPDPCCGGNPLAIDCALHATLMCIEDADPCSARAYGCADGAYFLDDPMALPATCAGDAADEGPRLLLGPEDGTGADESDAASEDGALADVPDGGTD